MGLHKEYEIYLRDEEDERECAEAEGRPYVQRPFEWHGNVIVGGPSAPEDDHLAGEHGHAAEDSESGSDDVDSIVIDSLAETLISWRTGRIVQQPDDAIVIEVESWGAEECDDLGEALDTWTRLDPDYDGPISCSVDDWMICTAADEADLDELFPRSNDGWVKVDGTWIPARFHPDYHDVSELPEIYSNVDLGSSAHLYEWDGHLLLVWSGPEGEDSGWELLGRISRADAESQADDKVFEITEDWSLNFDPFIGLCNLDPDEQHDLPSAARTWRSYSSWWSYGETMVADLIVHQLPTDDGTEYLVTRKGSTTVIGRYGSESSFDAALLEEAGLSIEYDDI